MGFSLRKGYGLDNKSLSGDFASKMWASYTQLNPGVYSDAIATEFKRRMKPDYTEYLLGLKGDAFVDSNLDGLADQFSILGSGNAYSIVTGNGFANNAQRIEKTDTTYLALRVTGVTAGSSNTYTFTYRSNKPVIITNSNIVLPANTGNAISYTFSAIFNAAYTSLTFSYGAPTEIGDWVEVGDLEMVSNIPSNYYTTFGPSGLNKTTADWIYLLTTSGNIVSRTITKSGNLLKWNLDGVTVTQNILPAYTKGTNAGVVTMTSTDGWSGVTALAINTNSFTGVHPNFNTQNVTSFNTSANLLTGRAGSLYATNRMSSANISGNLWTTAMIDAELAYYNTMFAVTPPIKNLTLNLSGATMGIPTGAGSNTDLLGVLAKFTAAGFTATIIVRTS